MPSSRRNSSARPANNERRTSRGPSNTVFRRSQENPFRVLGIAMIVDQRGVGAHLVARYPTQPSVPSPQGLDSSSTRGSTPMEQDDDETDPSANKPTKNSKNNEDDLFFTLTPRQMAKLFRTKKTLCGQPMTLNVNGTVFCCRAILMQDEETAPNTATTTATTATEDALMSSTTPGVTSVPSTEANYSSKDQLELFSVIVALSSPIGTSSTPFSDWYDGASEDQLDLQRYMADIATSTAKTVQRPGRTKAGKVSSTFLSIRRVHLSLARFCRVLEREEHRCQYVSLQANQFIQIRNERQKKWEEQKLGQTRGVGTSKQGPTSGGASTTSVGTNQTVSDHHRRPRPHMRSGSFSMPLTPSTDRVGGGGGGGGGVEDRSSFNITASMSNHLEQELEQETLELMLAAPPPSPSEDAGSTEKQRQHHYGNLARELVQIFHSLSRNDHDFTPTPESLLSERDGVVYVNQHIAIPVEAVSLNPAQSNQGRTAAVRPYHTLLFPHTSPSELLQTFQSSGSAPPQRLQQLLLTVNPQKPLSDIAIDANLPQYTTMEIASYLVAHGACVTSPIVSRLSRLGCFQIYRIPTLALDFSHSFPNVDLFRLVSFLSSSKTLGEAMSTLTNLDSDDGLWLRESLASPSLAPMLRSSSLTSLGGSPQHDERTSDANLTGLNKEPAPATGAGVMGVVRGQDQQQSQNPQQSQQQQQQQQGAQQSHQWVEELEELLYAMAIWLLSHRVLSQVQEYLLVVEKSDDANAAYYNSTNIVATHSNNPAIGSSDTGETLFRELLESDLLNGNFSVSALSWRLGFDPPKLRSWACRHERIRIISRIPAPGDDWESNA
jgi:hypothetical protein